MTSNQIKLIACVCMVVDHIGFLFFPEVQILRWIGRIAFPIFAYFIGEGAYYTSRPTRYFWRVFGLAVFCQLFYSAERFWHGDFSEIYLNILFSFALSLLLCFTYLRARESLRSGYPNVVLVRGTVFVCTAFILALLCVVCMMSEERIGVRITLDYGFAGVFLPLFAVLHRSKKRKRISYLVGVLLYVLASCLTTWYSVFALLSLPILYFHNGKQGNKKLQPVFYAFYPLHFAILYLIDLFV